jgi:hypothetical protein
MKYLFLLASAAAMISNAHAQSIVGDYPVGTNFGAESPVQANGTQCDINPGLATLYHSPNTNTLLMTFTDQGAGLYYSATSFSVPFVTYYGVARFVFASPTVRYGAVFFDNVTPNNFPGQPLPPVAKLIFYDFRAVPNPNNQTLTVTAKLRFTAPGDLTCEIPLRALFHVTK